MFRAILCSSSGGQIVCIQHLVSSLSMSGRGGRAVHRLREKDTDITEVRRFGKKKKKGNIHIDTMENFYV